MASLSGKFLFQLPIWVLIYEPTFRELGLPGGVARVDSARGLVLVLFTDEDLGRRHIAASGEADRGLHPIHEKAEFVALLKVIKLAGVSYVGFDAPAPGSPVGGVFFGIDDLIRIADQA